MDDLILVVRGAWGKADLETARCLGSPIMRTSVRSVVPTLNPKSCLPVASFVCFFVKSESSMVYRREEDEQLVAVKGFRFRAMRGVGHVK